MTTKEDLLEDVDCPLCDSSSASFVLSSKDFYNEIEGVYHVQKCNDCSFIYTSPRPKIEMLKHFYPDEALYYKPVVPKMDGYFFKLKKLILINYMGYPGSKNEFIKFLLFPIYLFFRSRIFIQGYPEYKGKGMILDIGSSYGGFLYQMSNLGWKTKGLEMNFKAAEFGQRKLNLDIESKMLHEFKPQSSYDVVTMRMVLEHLKDPKATLKMCKSLLNENGQLIFSVPDFSGFESKLYKEYAYTLHLPVHFNHFTPQSISQLLKECGYRNIKIYHQRSTNDLLAPLGYLKKDGKDKKYFRMLLNTSLGKLCIVKPFIYLLSILGKTSRMTVYAHKLV